MKTTYLDNKIMLLEDYEKDGKITPYQKRELKEYKHIKQLLLHNVSQQRELLIAFSRWMYENVNFDRIRDEEIESYLSEFKSNL
jgi:hypothetical protein